MNPATSFLKKGPGDVPCPGLNTNQAATFSFEGRVEIPKAKGHPKGRVDEARNKNQAALFLPKWQGPFKNGEMT